MNRGILDFYTGSKVLLQNDVDRHHVMPRAQFPESTRARADNIANIAFIVGDVNKTIGQSDPEVYLPSVGLDVLKSQCIPTNGSLWAINRADDFGAARPELLAESFNDFVRSSLPQRRLGPVSPSRNRTPERSVPFFCRAAGPTDLEAVTADSVPMIGRCSRG